MAKNSSANTIKRKEINSREELKVLDLHKDNPNSPFKINIQRKKKFNSRDILRLHSNLIRSFISGSIDSNEAKTLSYLCSNYLEALKQIEFEERLIQLENRIGE